MRLINFFLDAVATLGFLILSFIILALGEAKEFAPAFALLVLGYWWWYVQKRR